MVLWWTGRHRQEPIAAGDSVITHADVVSLQTYLGNGGRLFLTGQDVAERLSATPDSLFLVSYLGARYKGSARDPIVVSGLAGDPIGENLALVIAGGGGAANQTDSDSLRPVPGASVSYRYSIMPFPPDGEGGVAAVAYAGGPFKTVFWGFGLEAVTDIGLGMYLPPYDVTREQALSRVLYWLVDLQTGILDEDENTNEETTETTVPSRFTLFQNYPNPFNGRTTIEFAVVQGGPAAVTIEVFDILGRRVTTLFEGAVEPGTHQVSWAGIDRHGQQVASGVYFYRFSTTDGHIESRRMVYLK